MKKIIIHNHHPEYLALTWKGIAKTIFDDKIHPNTLREWARTDGFPVITLPNGLKATTRTLVDLWFVSRMGEQANVLLSNSQFRRLSLRRQKTYLSALVAKGEISDEKVQEYIEEADQWEKKKEKKLKKAQERTGKVRVIHKGTGAWGTASKTPYGRSKHNRKR